MLKSIALDLTHFLPLNPISLALEPSLLAHTHTGHSTLFPRHNTPTGQIICPGAFCFNPSQTHKHTHNAAVPSCALACNRHNETIRCRRLLDRFRLPTTAGSVENSAAYYHSRQRLRRVLGRLHHRQCECCDRRANSISSAQAASRTVARASQARIERCAIVVRNKLPSYVILS